MVQWLRLWAPNAGVWGLIPGQETRFCMSMKVLVTSIISDSVIPWTVCSPPDSSVLGILQARILEWVAMPSSRGIFLIQGSNPGLLPCKKILYLLSHQGRSHMPQLKPSAARSINKYFLLKIKIMNFWYLQQQWWISKINMPSERSQTKKKSIHCMILLI